ncbi:hypothetical protein [Metabacillus sediminilitoris]|uniref:Uncharacterized protein n=1 Tax=Metabacillus sediminilitoris TaxID=2567941 RepID=A0A4V3WF95_9BACI|nr:hypothetical protein [Metabacillus sediminilitoris]THF79409.1 hypothetical protein E6W99_13830 [Metabacillus sediminilitoris]
MKEEVIVAPNPSAVKYSIECLNRRLVKWAMYKFMRFRGHRARAGKWRKELRKEAYIVSALGSWNVSLMAER